MQSEKLEMRPLICKEKEAIYWMLQDRAQDGAEDIPALRYFGDVECCSTVSRQDESVCFSGVALACSLGHRTGTQGGLWTMVSGLAMQIRVVCTYQNHARSWP
jgi:hypothetical protein